VSDAPVFPKAAPCVRIEYRPVPASVKRHPQAKNPTPNSREVHGYLYVAIDKAGLLKHGGVPVIKIGRTKDLGERRPGLNIGMPSKSYDFHVWEYLDNAKAAEDLFKESFEDQHLAGECYAMEHSHAQQGFNWVVEKSRKPVK
jgi:hypothetical protein